MYWIFSNFPEFFKIPGWQIQYFRWKVSNSKIEDAFTCEEGLPGSFDSDDTTEVLTTVDNCWQW